MQIEVFLNTGPNFLILMVASSFVTFVQILAINKFLMKRYRLLFAPVESKNIG